MSRVDRDRQITLMRKNGMQVEQIARACGVSGRTVARILSRRGPSRSDEGIVHQYDTEAEIAAMARQNGQQSALRAMGVKIRSPFPAIRPGQNQGRKGRIYSSAS